MDIEPLHHEIKVQKVRQRHQPTRYDVIFGSKRIVALTNEDAQIMAGLIAAAINGHSIDAVHRVPA